MPLQTTPKPSGALQEILITESTTTFSPPFNCKALVYVIGAGGSGGAITVEVVNDTQGAASGGGAGGLAISLLQLSSSVNYTATIGDGGTAPVTADAANQTASGNNGGNSEFSGSGIATMTANGGSAGAASVQTGGTTATATGGAGGTATGGNLSNITGGSAGLAEDTGTTSGGACASGGGGVGILGVAYDGGDATASFSGAGSGGAGVGGKGGNATATTTATETYGGNYLGAGPDATNASGDPVLSFVNSVTADGPNVSVFDFNQSAQTGSSQNQYRGVGGRGRDGGTNAGTGGLFSGGGGTSRAGTATTGGGGGEGGGGGGGSAHWNRTSGTATGGVGGDGMVIIRILEAL